MKLKTVVESIVESLKEKGIDEESISHILQTWQLREGINNLEDEEYSREKTKSLFDIIEAHLKVEQQEEPKIISSEPVESIEEEPLEEEALEKELEELVKFITSEPEPGEQAEPVIEEASIEEETYVDEAESDIEKELRDFAEFLRRTQEQLEKEEPITISEEVEEVEEAIPEGEFISDIEEKKEEETVKIVEEEEEQKLKSLVEELVEETRETPVTPETTSDIDIKGLRLAAVIEDKTIQKLLIFKKPERDPRISALIAMVKRLWELTGYEIQDFDSFHVRSGAVILYVEKIEGLYYLVVVESETVGGARFIAHALRKLIK